MAIIKKIAIGHDEKYVKKALLNNQELQNDSMLMSRIFNEQKPLLKSLVAKGLLGINPDGTYK